MRGKGEPGTRLAIADDNRIILFEPKFCICRCQVSMYIAIIATDTIKQLSCRRCFNGSSCVRNRSTRRGEGEDQGPRAPPEHYGIFSLHSLSSVMNQ